MKIWSGGIGYLIGIKIWREGIGYLIGIRIWPDRLFYDPILSKESYEVESRSG